VVKRTSINLDMDLVEEAARELGTQRTTDTIHEALRDVIARARRARLAQRDFEDLTPESLEAMRRRPDGLTEPADTSAWVWSRCSEGERCSRSHTANSSSLSSPAAIARITASLASTLGLGLQDHPLISTKSRSATHAACLLPS
jgi:Arc/MetJ family transcription regulator